MDEMDGLDGWLLLLLRFCSREFVSACKTENTAGRQLLGTTWLVVRGRTLLTSKTCTIAAPLEPTDKTRQDAQDTQDTHDRTDTGTRAPKRGQFVVKSAGSRGTEPALVRLEPQA